jgi:hypothetical protein
LGFRATFAAKSPQKTWSSANRPPRTSRTIRPEPGRTGPLNDRASAVALRVQLVPYELPWGETRPSVNRATPARQIRRKPGSSAPGCTDPGARDSRGAGGRLHIVVRVLARMLAVLGPGGLEGFVATPQLREQGASARRAHVPPLSCSAPSLRARSRALPTTAHGRLCAE